MTVDPQPGSADGDERIIEALRNEFLRPPPPEVERRHLDDLQAALGGQEPEGPRGRLRPLVAAVAGLAVIASGSWLIVDRGSGNRVQTADDSTSTVIAADPTTTSSTASTAAAGPVESVDHATSEPTDLLVDPAPEGTGTTSSISGASTLDPGPASSGPTSSGSPSSSASSPTTAGATTSSSAEPQDTTNTTGPTTTTTRTTTTSEVSSTTVGAPSTQLRLEVAWLAMNECLIPRGYLFVGFPGISDHPDTALPGYQVAVVDCDRTSGVGAVMDDIEAWGATLTPAERDAHNGEIQGVADCMTRARSWDFALGPTPDGVLTITRFPAVPVDLWLLLGLDLAACGWLDLDLP